MTVHKQIIVDEDLWKILMQQKLDRNFKSINSLLWNAVIEESDIQPGLGKEDVKRGEQNENTRARTD